MDIDVLDEDGQFVKNDNNLYMDGKAIFEFTSFVSPSTFRKVFLCNIL